MRKTHCLTHENIKLTFSCAKELILRTKFLFGPFLLPLLSLVAKNSVWRSKSERRPLGSSANCWHFEINREGLVADSRLIKELSFHPDNSGEQCLSTYLFIIRYHL